MCFFLRHSFVALAMCFGSFSCWNTIHDTLLTDPDCSCGHVKVTCSQRLMRWMFDVQGSIFPPNVCSIQKTNLTPDCFCSWVEVVLKGLALWERDTHWQTERERDVFCYSSAEAARSGARLGFSERFLITELHDCESGLMAETQGISHVFVSEGGQRKLKYRAERQSWTVWQLKHYSNIYWFNSILTQH